MDKPEKIRVFISGNLSFERLLRTVLGNEQPPTKSGKKGPILAIAKTDEGREKLLNHPNEKVRQLMEARIAVRSWPLHQRRIERMERIVKAAGGKLPIPLKYAGAHTCRWAGGGGVNLQNLPARGHPLINEIRTLIEAPPGYTLIISDFCQVEARTLDWLANQRDMLQAFADGRQIYCEFASKLIGHRVRKPKKTDSEAVAKWHGNYRQMGKIGILGAGYGMGVDRCIDYARDTYKIDISYEMGESIIKLYRRTHRQVVRFWGDVENSFRQATLYPGTVYTLPFGLRFFRDGGATVIQLPSTRRLYYTGATVTGSARYPQLTMHNPKPGARKAIDFWGGYLVENIVQSTARDLLAETILKVEQLGVRAAITVHDDFSVIVPEKEVETWQSRIEQIARTSPTWAPGLPIDVECKISRRYSK